MLIVILVFIAGWLSSDTWSKISDNENHKKNNDNYNSLSTDSKEEQNLMEFERIERLFAEETGSKEKNSPYDWIKLEQINVYEDEVIIRIEKPEWAIYTDTNSMDPLIDSTSNAIEIIPKTKEDIHLGDIVAYEPELKEGIVTHRVIDIGQDEEGWYAILKGDNNEKPDPGKVRFWQIRRVVVAIIY